MIATILQTEDLLQTIGASLVVGIGITFAFSVGIWGVGHFAELSRDERPAAAALAAVAAGLAFACVAAAVIIGIVVMSDK